MNILHFQNLFSIMARSLCNEYNILTNWKDTPFIRLNSEVYIRRFLGMNLIVSTGFLTSADLWLWTNEICMICSNAWVKPILSSVSQSINRPVYSNTNKSASALSECLASADVFYLEKPNVIEKSSENEKTVCIIYIHTPKTAYRWPTIENIILKLTKDARKSFASRSNQISVTPGWKVYV